MSCVPLIEFPDALLRRDYHGFWDDFTCTRDAAEWAVVAAAAGTPTGVVGDAAGGIMTLATGAATDNHGGFLERPVEEFKAAADKPLVFEARVQYTEAATDDANVFVGLIDAVAATSLADDGAGIAATGAFGFYKLDSLPAGSTTLWRAYVECNNVVLADVILNATNALDKTAHVAGTASAYQVLRIEVIPITATYGDVRFFIDGVLVYKYSGDILTSATELQVAFGLKNGGATQETLKIDYATCWQKR